MKTRTNLVLASALFLALGASGARAGNVAGKVEIGSTGIANAVVSIEGAHGSNPAARHAVIDQQNKLFIPHVVAVEKGGTVEFRNSDDFLHNTYSVSKTQTFDLHQPARGSRSLLKTDKPGVIEVRCHIHGNMQAWVVVTDGPYFAVTDEHGIFHINGVPPGTYRIKTWTEQHGELTQTVTVGGGNSTVIVKYAR
ncbi:MAG TPA: hypothetical protein VFA07_19565 [Chthonomonadaceae bacterium]|nr:hypothetical protein [Chthonomonadaceae bacterium]